MSGDALIGVINSIGVRRDEQAVDLLVDTADRAIESGDDEIAAAAMAALGKIASPAAIAALREGLDGKDSLRIAAADGRVMVSGATCAVEDGDYNDRGDFFEWAGADSGT